MGRELRMVPANWSHPVGSDGEHIPLHKKTYEQASAEWDEEKAKWEEGLELCYKNYPTREWKPRDMSNTARFEDWAGDRPEPEEHMPEFPTGAATHFMMYEDTTEGTPISPAFATPEELARWLADTGASAFGNSTASYQAWLDTITRGFAVSAIVDSHGMRSGVEAMADLQ